MLKILLSNSFRSLRTQLPYSIINILGLTIGVASAIILTIWISVETSFDKFHKNCDSIYRVSMVLKTPNKDMNTAFINAPAGPEYKKEFPSIENMVRIGANDQSVTYNGRTSKLKLMYSDSTFFNMFSFDLITGNKNTCLQAPHSIVLTEKAAGKIFGSEDPVGKGLTISGEVYFVSAIAKNLPVNTSFQFECLVPLSTYTKNANISWDGGLDCYTFLRLAKGTNTKALEKQIIDFMEGAINKKYREFGYLITPYLQKLSDIHLKSGASYELGETGSLKKIYLFSGIGILILLIACFNFANINTALSFKRAKEISMMKIFGSGKRNIILLFLLESALSILISIILALVLVKIFLPITSHLLGMDLSLHIISPIAWIIISLTIFLFCTVFANFYSAFYLSSISPMILLSEVNRGKRRQYSRNILVTFQYTISIALIICCIVIYSQMQYIKKSDKGFTEKNILVLELSPVSSAKYETLLNRIASIPGVVSLSVSAGGQPGIGFTMNGYFPEGVTKPVLSRSVYVDENYIKTMRISISEGRDFMNPKSDVNKAIINQTFAKMVGWNNPLGKKIERNNIKYEVIGVVKDFNTSSFYSKTEPLFISTVNEWKNFGQIEVRYLPSGITGILTTCESILKEADPDSPVEYEFLEDAMATSYSKDQKINLLFLVFSIIAIFISSLGLFGLATFSMQSRTKEISIRKISGATISQIFIKYNADLLKWIILSFIIATPIGCYAMNKWLGNFAYKTSINIWIVFFAGFLTLVVGMLTVSWAANKAARTNPAETLRKE